MKKLLVFSIISLAASKPLFADGKSLQVNVPTHEQQTEQTLQDAQKKQIHDSLHGHKTLLKQLNQENDPEVKMRLLALISHAQLSSSTISDLDSYVFDDPNPLVRSQAVAALAAIGSDPKVISSLADVLSGDTDSSTRRQAAFWLGTFKASASVSALDKALREEEDPNVRVQIALSLRMIGTGSAKSALNYARNDTDKRVKDIANGK